MLLAVPFLAACAAVGGDGPAVHRHPGPLEKVLQEAGEKDRPVLLEFHRESEKACLWMDRTVWSGADVVAQLDGSLLVYRVEDGKGECAALADRFTVSAWPTMVFLDSEGNELERQNGLVGKAFLLSVVEEVAGGNHVRAMQRRLDRRPDDAALHAKLGVRQFLHGDPGAAVHLERALELDPKKEKEATKEAAFIEEVREAMTGGSAGPLKAFLEKYPDCGAALEVHRALARTLTARDDFPGQVPSLEFILDRAPDDEARNNLAWGLAKSGKDLERALSLVEEALKGSPGSNPFLDTKAECLSRLGRHDEALELERKVIGLLSPSTPRDRRAEYEKHLKEIEKRRDDAKK
jgi:thioredoxin-related protein